MLKASLNLKVKSYYSIRQLVITRYWVNIRTFLLTLAFVLDFRTILSLKFWFFGTNSFFPEFWALFEFVTICLDVLKECRFFFTFFSHSLKLKIDLETLDNFKMFRSFYANESKTVPHNTKFNEISLLIVRISRLSHC